MCGSFNITQIQGFRISILFRCNTCIVILQGENLSRDAPFPCHARNVML